MNGAAVFPSCYLPSIEYFSLLNNFNQVKIDVNLPFKKQTVRNRTFILSPNGIQCLSVPVLHASHQQLMKDVRISNAESWQKIHWRAIQAAYGRSPYFEFFADDLENIYQRDYSWLIDLNNDLFLLLFRSLKLRVCITDSLSGDIIDNNALAERKNFLTNEKNIQPYNQVFMYKFGFVSGLSMLDLVLNTGTQAASLL